MIDSHVHLNHDDFNADRDAVIKRAKAAGVSHMVNIGFDLPSSEESAAYAELYPFMYAAVGVHPHDAKAYNESVEEKLTALLAKPRVIAVGEIGLDYYRDLSPRDLQQEAFRSQLRLAKRLGKPIIIHCRDAFEDVVALLRDEADEWQGIFHAFTGDAEMAKTVLDMGFHIGIGGVVTFRKSGVSEVVTNLPAESIVLETDCPYLTPVPYRGKRNEPSYLKYVVEEIAKSTGRPPVDIHDETDANFARAMGLGT